MKSQNHFSFFLVFFLVSVFGPISYSMTQDQTEETTQGPSKKQKTGDWEISYSHHNFILEDPNSNQITYPYTTTDTKKCVHASPLFNKEGDFLCDSTEQWICIVIFYQGTILGGLAKEIVLISPSQGMYIVLSEEPLIENDILVISPFTFAPQIVDSNKQTDWNLEVDYKKGETRKFLTDGFNNLLLDHQGRSYCIQKIVNKNSKQVIYSLHLLGNEPTTSINISEYLKRDHNIEIKEIDPHARFFYDITQLLLFFYVIDKQTEEKIPLVINLINIQNRYYKTILPFLRADLYNRLAPIINEKNTHQWQVLHQQELVNEQQETIRDAQGNKFIYRISGHISGPIISALYLVDKNGTESGINLAYYLWRDFDCAPSNDLTNVKISDNGQFLHFSTGDHHWAIEISDLKYLKQGTIYAPIMNMDNIVNSKYKYTYSSFVTLNLDKCHVNTKKIKVNNTILEYGKQIPVYIQWQDEDIQITLFARDQLRCRDTNAFFNVECPFKDDDDESLQIEGPTWSKDLSDTGGSDKSVPENRKIYVCSTFAHILDREAICFDPNFLLPEKLEFREIVESTDDYYRIDTAQKDLSFFVGELATKDLSAAAKSMILNTNNILKKILLPASMEKLTDDLLESLKKNHNPEYKQPFQLFKRMSEACTDQFIKTLRIRNWSSVANEDCIISFQKLEYLIVKNDFTYINLNKHEYFIKTK